MVYWSLEKREFLHIFFLKNEKHQVVGWVTEAVSRHGLVDSCSRSLPGWAALLPQLVLNGGNRLQRRLFLSPQAGPPQTSWKGSGGGGGFSSRQTQTAPHAPADPERERVCTFPDGAKLTFDPLCLLNKCFSSVSEIITNLDKTAKNSHTNNWEGASGVKGWK